MELLEFYPTPDSLLDKILAGINWSKVSTILEPSAGKGNIVSYIMNAADKYPYYNSRLQIDCIEKDETLHKHSLTMATGLLMTISFRLTHLSAMT